MPLVRSSFCVVDFEADTRDVRCITRPRRTAGRRPMMSVSCWLSVESSTGFLAARYIRHVVNRMNSPSSAAIDMMTCGMEAGTAPHRAAPAIRLSRWLPINEWISLWIRRRRFGFAYHISITYFLCHCSCLASDWVETSSRLTVRQDSRALRRANLMHSVD